ncbi:MAG: hypothetical protein WA185_10585, partial [Candidatus Acidiferrales bacterium]
MTRIRGYALVICMFVALPTAAQAPSLSDVYGQIRAEETNNSKIMWIIHEIADVYGPRLTGTPNLKAADDWAVRTMTSWGLSNVHLEPWTFQPPTAATPVPGWANKELTAEAVAPFHGSLMVEPLAWTPSTKGEVTAEVVTIDPPGLTTPTGGFGFGAPAPAAAAQPSGMPPPMPAPPATETPKQPTQEELDAYLNSVKDKVRGHIVLVGKHVEVPEDFTPAPLRRSDSQWGELFDPNNTTFQRFVNRQAPQLGPGQLSRAEVMRQVDQFLVDNGSLVRINDAGRAHG